MTDDNYADSALYDSGYKKGREEFIEALLSDEAVEAASKAYYGEKHPNIPTHNYHLELMKDAIQAAIKTADKEG